MSPIDEALSALPSDLLDRSGRVFYTGKTAFERRSDLYILGLNPGGSIERQAGETIARDIACWEARAEPWSAYCDEKWKNAKRGESPLQLRLRHLFDRIGRMPAETPASNAIFTRSNDEAALTDRKDELMATCWPVHRAVIGQLGIRTILCFGGTVARWVCQQLGANSVIADGFEETNKRKWRSSAAISPAGIAIVQLPHPARSDWRASTCDPSAFVRAVVER